MRRKDGKKNGAPKESEITLADNLLREIFSFNFGVNSDGISLLEEQNEAAMEGGNEIIIPEQGRALWSQFH